VLLTAGAAGCARLIDAALRNIGADADEAMFSELNT
jgi:hypothetical protein